METASMELEVSSHDDDLVGGVVIFETKPKSTDPVERISLDTRTWKRMGYPHFVTVTVKTSK